MKVDINGNFNLARMQTSMHIYITVASVVYEDINSGCLAWAYINTPTTVTLIEASDQHFHEKSGVKYTKMDKYKFWLKSCENIKTGNSEECLMNIKTRNLLNQEDKGLLTPTLL